LLAIRDGAVSHHWVGFQLVSGRSRSPIILWGPEKMGGEPYNSNGPLLFYGRFKAKCRTNLAPL
jgi:hypothetical protein